MWYHLSDTWKKLEETIYPKSVRCDTNFKIDKKPCICVCPSILECIVALGEWRDFTNVSIYITDGKPIPASWVFDYSITNEHRFYNTCKFIKIGNLNIEKLSQDFPRKPIYGKININNLLNNLKEDKSLISKTLQEYIC